MWEWGGEYMNLHSNGFCSPKAQTKYMIHASMASQPLNYMTTMLCQSDNEKKVQKKFPQSGIQTKVASQGFQDALK